MAIKESRQKTTVAAKPAQARQRLLSARRIALFTLLVAGIMVLLYPRDKLVQQITQMSSHDALSRAYLDNMLRKDPGNAPLRLQRFEAELADHHLAEAERILLGLADMTDPDIRLSAARALPRLRERQLHALPVDSARHRKALAALHQALEALATWPLERDERLRLAEQAAASDAWPLAMRLYNGLSIEDPTAVPHWIDAAAKLGLGHRRYREVAALYFAARERTTRPDIRSDFYLKGIAALLAGNLPAEALAAAELHLGELAYDPAILLRLVHLARAVNRNDRAEFYVRRLLNYAALGVTMRLASEAMPGPVSASRSDALALSARLSACAVTGQAHRCLRRIASVEPPRPRADVQPVNGTPQLPFDDKIYRLGYDVFLANRNLRDAFAVASAAVRQAPERADWRERLAQVAEWYGQPAQALTQWRHLAQTRNSDRDWQALLRLAPGLFDHPTLILALKREYQLGRLDDAGLRRLIQSFEADGDPGEALALLRQAYQRQPRRFLLEQEAVLAERMGRTADAMAALRRLAERHGARSGEVRRLAALHIMQGDWEAAYQILQQHQAIARSDRDYQALMADLAWRMQDKPAARQLYQVLQSSGTLADYETERLILLMNDSSPQAAAVLALRYWQTQRAERFATLALSLLIQARDPAAARRLLDSLTPAEREKLEQHSVFLEQRAEIARLEGRPLAAIVDLERALALDPDNLALQTNLLWARVEARQREPLADDVARLHARAQSEPILWAPMAAAWVALDRPREALPYFARQATERSEDYLWHIGYAQVLEDVGQADVAWRLRRHAWLHLRRAGKPAPGDAEAWLTQARLALKMAPGDLGARWLREALRQDRAAHKELSPEARELATAWLLSSGQNESARLWLVQQYGRQLAAPRWAEAALALQNNDTAALRRIADGADDDLPAETRAAAALQLREYALARKLAFDGLARKPDSDTLHGQLVESRWQQQNRVAVAVRNETLGALESTALRTNVQWEIRPQLKMGLELVEHRLRSNDSSQLLNPPANDLRFTLSGRLDHGIHETGLKLFARSALDTVVGLQIDHQLRLDRRLRVGATLGINTEANETAQLKAGGVKDALRLNLEWQIGAREYLLAEAAYNRYLGQDRSELGSGGTLALQAGHRLRIAYPDLTVKLIGNGARFDTDGPASGIITQLLPSGVGAMPTNSTQFGVGLGLGESIFESPSRAFRPYTTFDLLHGNNAGWGHGFELGFVVSPTGGDWLRGRWRDGRTRFTGDQNSRLIELEYRYLF